MALIVGPDKDSGSDRPACRGHGNVVLGDEGPRARELCIDVRIVLRGVGGEWLGPEKTTKQVMEMYAVFKKYKDLLKQ